MRVKICGITNDEDAAAAVGMGAWGIGMIHAEGPRQVDPGMAAQIGAEYRRQTEIVGVFVNPTLEAVVRAAENASLSMVQLNGNEGPSFCAEVARRTGARVIKAIHVSSAADIHAAETFRTIYHLLDTKKAGMWGGTGKTFDWNLAGERTSKIPLILAGGLNPGNVAEAISIVHPVVVDVASGVEAEPGRKDHAVMQAFFDAANGVTAEATPDLEVDEQSAEEAVPSEAQTS